VLVGGCARAPAPEICPRIEPGELVISELRGPQTGNDVVDPYIELYNASGRTLDLQGVWIRQIARNGAQHELVIRESLKVADGGYVVIGPGLDEPNAWVDYAVGWDIPGGNAAPDEGGEAQLPTDLLRYPDGGFFELESCDELIDAVEVGVDVLPQLGTLACGNGQTPPDAEANDLATDPAADPAADPADASCWCVDAEPAEPNFQYPGIGLPGTPGSANRCP
jgi:hypothetical protein